MYLAAESYFNHKFLKVGQTAFTQVFTKCSAPVILKKTPDPLVRHYTGGGQKLSTCSTTHSSHSVFISIKVM